MARPQRIAIEEGYYHVMNRGAGRENIYSDEFDKQAFLQVIEEACEQYKVEILSYCLMDNHYHLLLKTPNANISRTMRHINGVYTQRYNRRHVTDGPLFRGRYKAILVDSDAYLLHLTKYIHLNPLTAKMVKHLDNYPWSSYLAYVGKVQPKPWLKCEEVYEQLTNTGNKAKKYEAFTLDLDIHRDLVTFYSHVNLPPILGGEDFTASLKLSKPSKETPKAKRAYHRASIADIVNVVSDFFNEEPEHLLRVKRGPQKSNLGRKVAMYISRKHEDYRLQDIAKAFNLTSYGSASSAIYWFTQELEKDMTLQKTIHEVIAKLENQKVSRYKQT